MLFFDEPTSALDPEAAFIVRDAIETLRAQGRTIVLCQNGIDLHDVLTSDTPFVAAALAGR